MDTNEHETLLNITQIQVNKQYLYCCSIFHHDNKEYI